MPLDVIRNPILAFATFKKEGKQGGMLKFCLTKRASTEAVTISTGIWLQSSHDKESYAVQVLGHATICNYEHLKAVTMSLQTFIINIGIKRVEDGPPKSDQIALPLSLSKCPKRAMLYIPLLRTDLCLHSAPEPFSEQVTFFCVECSTHMMESLPVQQ